MKEVHEAWEHLVPKEEAAAARAARARPAVYVDAGGLAWRRLVARVLFMLLMLALLVLLTRVVDTHQGAGGEL